MSDPLPATKEERAQPQMRPPKGTDKAVKCKVYSIIDSRYSILGTNAYQETETTAECLEHYISLRKEAAHISDSMYQASHRNRSKYYATPKSAR